MHKRTRHGRRSRLPGKRLISKGKRGNRKNGSKESLIAVVVQKVNSTAVLWEGNRSLWMMQMLLLLSSSKRQEVCE